MSDSFSDWFAQNPEMLQQLLQQGGGGFSMAEPMSLGGAGFTVSNAPAPAAPAADAIGRETLPMPGSTTAPVALPPVPVLQPAQALQTPPGAPAAAPGGAQQPRTVSIMGRDTGMTPAELTAAIGGVGQAVRGAGGAPAGGGGMLPPAGAVQSMGNPAALVQLLQQRQALRQAIRVPGLLQR